MTRDEARETRCYYDSTRCDKCDGVVELHGQEYVDDGSVVPDAVYRAGYAAGRRDALEEAAKECEKFAIFAKQVECPKHGAWLDKTHAVCGPCHEEALAELRSIRALLDEEKK